LSSTLRFHCCVSSSNQDPDWGVPVAIAIPLVRSTFGVVVRMQFLIFWRRPLGL
jgi:hypothetical protein